MSVPIIPALFCIFILFTSHFIEDSYIPVYLWMKYIRRPPGMGIRIISDGGIISIRYDSSLSGQSATMVDVPVDPNLRGNMSGDILDLISRIDSGLSAEAAEEEIRMKGFIEFIDTVLGKILLIAFDQIIHIIFLVPIAWALASYARR